MLKVYIIYLLNLSICNSYFINYNINYNINPYFKTHQNRMLHNKINIYMEFEESDSDFNIDPNFFNKTLPQTNYIQNIEYDEIHELWSIDLDFSNITEVTLNNNSQAIELHMHNEINETNINTFPSFYEFLRERELRELTEKNEYLKKANDKYKNFNPTSKDLKLLSSFSSAEWCKTWLYEMIHVPDYFPTFMFQDMFRLRDFSQKNNSKQYFYIGYYPSDSYLKKGPFYIGAFELEPEKREFRTYIIIQNPYYCAENIYDENKMKNFKKELIAMTKDAFVFFKYDNLKDTTDQRYYYSWLYEE